MKICIVPADEAGEAGDNSSCVASEDGELSAMSPEDMEVVVAKIISLLALTILSVLSGLLPLRLLLHLPQLFTRHRSTVDYFLCGLRCLSGGVFLATGFLHLLPDTREKMAAVLVNLGSRTTYAVTELLIMAGFFLVVFVEQIIKFLYVKAERSDQLRAANGDVGSGTGGGGVEAAGGTGNGTGACNSNGGGRSPDDNDSDSVGSDTLMKEEHCAFADHRDEFDYPPHDFDYDIEHVPVTLRCSRHSMTLRRTHSLPELGVTKVVKQLSQADLTRRAHFRSIIYIMALSLHGIFEGLALGLQSTESSVWSLCFALCLHRCVLAFQLGMDLCGARESQGTAFLCIGTFTLISAVGIVAGILFSSGAMLYANVTVPEAILQSLATGTILYIVFFDILFKDLQGVGDLKRVSCCFVGFALMAIILAVTTR
nr:hypothetical protein BaRGS_027942 [Batillaria attramentaria]